MKSFSPIARQNDKFIKSDFEFLVMRMYFFIDGERVQNVGLRARILLLMHSLKLVGFADNVATGKSVAIRCWGEKSGLQNFYQLMEEKKPKSTELSKTFFDNEKMPRKLEQMNEMMYYNLEQMDKFIGLGKELREEIKEMRKELKIGFNRVVTAIEIH